MQHGTMVDWALRQLAECEDPAGRQALLITVRLLLHDAMPAGMTGQDRPQDRSRGASAAGGDDGSDAEEELGVGHPEVSLIPRYITREQLRMLG